MRRPLFEARGYLGKTWSKVKKMQYFLLRKSHGVCYSLLGLPPAHPPEYNASN